MAKSPGPPKTVETPMHEADERKDIPTAEIQSVVKEEQQSPIRRRRGDTTGR
jgi:adenine-specific DNA-methyltransferase